ncbi:hypothetical protein CK203_097645 [Vitis vinifera]|uniref:Disease resistance N-terminal domain-containing protein n=1 Tax=Vitis vinifera TaxID=29760 RepID=A0A438D570_VITVI|nr:hypothetical protein CK203_097645 [Vitis vinifera]
MDRNLCLVSKERISIVGHQRKELGKEEASHSFILKEENPGLVRISKCMYDERIKLWVEPIREVAHDAEDLIDEFIFNMEYYLCHVSQ